ncbi:MAG: EAL domain-containing protein [Oceanospirillaceae bacterium]
MKKNWDWLDNSELIETVSPHVLCQDKTLYTLFNAVIKTAEAAWDMSCSVILLDVKQQTLHSAAAPSLPSFYNNAINGLKIGPGIGCCGTAAFSKELVLVEDIQTHPYWSDYKELAMQAGLAACWSTPILNSQGSVLGTFACYFAQVRKPSTRQLSFLEGAGQTLAIAIEQRQLQKVVSQLSYFDPLTGLQNRTAFRKCLQEYIDNQQKFALLFVDLDNFKEVNDSLGHEAGDSLIQTLSGRFNRIDNPAVIFSRIGGDEFTVIYNQPVNRQQVSDFALELIEIINQPVICSGSQVAVGASIGIACFPEHSTELSQLMKYADIAMYHAKNKGRNCSYFFDREMRVALMSRLDMQQELREAITKKQFDVYFQPQIDNFGHELVGVEALLRWNHPNRGVLAAAEFIEAIEICGLSKKIDLWVLEQSCKLLAEIGGSFTLSVNISASYLSQTCFPERVFSILQRTGFVANRLVFELVERALIANTELAKPVMQELEEQGVRFSIDDFGTGYSSLSYLKTLPISEVKIDKSFVHEVCYDKIDNVICSSLCCLAKKLDLTVVAEGVECLSQKQALEEMGCDTVQGYFISYPLPFTELIQYAKEKNSCLVALK